MKKLTIITTALMLFLATTGYAWGGGEGEKKSSKKETAKGASNLGATATTVTKDITNSFATKFSGAQNVSWKQREEFYFAEFKLNQKDMFAAYNDKGELLGFSRNIEFKELPLNLQMAIREGYADHKIDNIITEMVLDGETTYHFQAENKTRYMKLKCDSYGQITVEKRTKKKLIGSVY